MLRDEIEPRQSALAAAFHAEVVMVARPAAAPVLEYAGTFEPPPALRDEILRQRRFLSAPGRYNEHQALADEPFDRTAEPIRLRYRTIEYAAVRALRATGTAPRVLSASVLPVCLERRCFYMQRRSPFVDLAPSLLHCFAGAFQPGGRSGSNGDGGLIQTALREFAEETGETIGFDPALTPLSLFLDRKSGSLELVLLGQPISGAVGNRLRHCEEGEIVEIGFDQLPEALADRGQWSPGGRLLVLSWLAFGTAMLPEPPHFSGRTAEMAFWHCLGST